MLFGEAEVDNIYLTTVLVFSYDEICGLDVSVDEALRMNVVDAVKHLHEKCHCKVQCQHTSLLLLYCGQILTKETHDYETLVTFDNLLFMMVIIVKSVLRLLLTQFWTPIPFNKFIDFTYILVTLELLKRVILKNEYSFGFVRLLYLESDVFLGFGVKSRVYGAKGTLTQLLKQSEPILNQHFVIVVFKLYKYLIISVSIDVIIFIV